MEVLHFGQTVSGSIVGITPGIALASGGSGGGSIVGITPGKSSMDYPIDPREYITILYFAGAALEKKSVRELAAGLSRGKFPPIESSVNELPRVDNCLPACPAHPPA